LSDHVNARVCAVAQINEALPSADGETLHVTFDNGTVFALPAQRLRAACRCAHCRRAQIDGVFADEFPAVIITGVVPIGHYAVNLAFSDGHCRGIYPWSYLAELAADLPL
jgi:DUF971 family protein